MTSINEIHSIRDNRSSVPNIIDICTDVLNNLKEMDDFISINQKLRNCAHDLITVYSQNKFDKIGKMQNFIDLTLMNLGRNNSSFCQKLRGNNLNVTNPIAPPNLQKEDFLKIYDLIARESNELNLKNEFQNKNMCLKIFFKFLLQHEDLKDYLNDILTEQHNGNLRKNLITTYENFKLRMQRNDELQDNNIFYEIQPQISNILGNKLNISISKSLSKISIVVGNIIQIQIKFNDSNNFSNGFKMSVSAVGEMSGNINNTSHSLLMKARNYFNISHLNADEKSCFKIYNKIGLFFETILEYFLKFSGYKQKGLLLFSFWLIQFKTLFKEKCSFCRKVMKFDIVDKAFFPPIYKRIEIPSNSKEQNYSDGFFHEDCFEWINNNHF